MNGWHYLKYFVAIAIFSIHLEVTAQTKLDITAKTPSIDFKRLSSWENAVMTHSLESATKIDAIAFSPDGQLLATIGEGKITIWNVEKGEIQRILPGHYSTETEMEIAPTAIAFSPDSRFLATSTISQGVFSPDSSILVRDITTGETVLDLSDPQGYWQVLFDVSGEIIYSAGDSGVTAWSFPDGDELFSFNTQHSVEAIAITPNGRVMATVDANVSTKPNQSNKIQLWQLDDRQPALLNTLDGHANEIAKLEFTADGKRLISSSYDGKIKVWNWQQGAIDSRINGLYSDGGVFSLGVDSRLIAGNFYSSAITDLNTGLPVRNTIATSDNKKTDIAFSPKQQLIAIVETSDSNTSINLWLADVPAEESSNPKTDYRPISIDQYWSDKPTSKDTSSIGEDPVAIARSALGLTEIVESEREEVELDYPSDNLATVTITQTNLADDSVAGIRYLVHFAPYGDNDAEKWQVVWAGQQFKCQPGRGEEDWSPDLCQ